MLNLKNIKKLIKIKEPEISPRKEEIILTNLRGIKQELKTLRQNIEYVTNPILLNQIIFQLKAAEIQYQYWYSIARELNISSYPEII